MDEMMVVHRLALRLVGAVQHREMTEVVKLSSSLSTWARNMAVRANCVIEFRKGADTVLSSVPPPMPAKRRVHATRVSTLPKSFRDKGRTLRGADHE